MLFSISNSFVFKDKGEIKYFKGVSTAHWADNFINKIFLKTLPGNLEQGWKVGGLGICSEIFLLLFLVCWRYFFPPLVGLVFYVFIFVAWNEKHKVFLLLCIPWHVSLLLQTYLFLLQDHRF